MNSNVEPKLSKKKAVVIGLGRMGQAHIQALCDLQIEIIGICDISQEKLNETKRRWQLQAKTYRHIESMLSASESPDLVVIATTADVHCGISCLAAEAKIPMILCEKPMARSLQECDKIINACKKYGSRFAVNHQMRFIPQYTFPKEALNSKRFGHLSSMNVVGGCFGVSMNGSHYIEAFHFLTESRPSEVTGWFSKESLPNPRGPTFLDKAGQLRIVSEDGKRLTMEIGVDQGHGMTTLYATQHGHIFVDELEGEMICVARKHEYIGLPATRYGSPWDRWQQRFKPFNNMEATKMVLIALLENNNYPSEETGKMVVNTLVAAYHSDENNHRSISLSDPNLPYERIFHWA